MPGYRFQHQPEQSPNPSSQQLPHEYVPIDHTVDAEYSLKASHTDSPPAKNPATRQPNGSLENVRDYAAQPSHASSHTIDQRPDDVKDHENSAPRQAAATVGRAGATMANDTKSAQSAGHSSPQPQAGNNDQLLLEQQQPDPQTGHAGQIAQDHTVNPVSDTATEIAGGSGGDITSAPRSDEVRMPIQSELLKFACVTPVILGGDPPCRLMHLQHQRCLKNTTNTAKRSLPSYFQQSRSAGNMTNA